MISDDILEITKKFENEFGNLSKEQLNWKPSSDKWSIGQCIDHLIVANNQYLPELNKVSESKHKETFWEKNNPLTDYTGQNMIKTLGPVIIKKYKTPKLFFPSKSSISINILSDFTYQQEELFKVFKILEDGKFSKIVITSPVAALLTLKVHDALKIISVHEERHLLQAIRIKQFETLGNPLIPK